MNIKALEKALKDKVNREYSMWFEHIRDIIEEKRDATLRVYNQKDSETVRIPLIKKNIELELALFLTDDINVEILTNWWALWEEIMKNANMVLKYDDVDMDLYEMREDIVNYNGYYGLAASIVDNRDDDEKQPITDTISPLNLIIDPKNYKGSKMRFIWVRRRVPTEWLKECPWFDKKQIEESEWELDNELTQTERAINNSVWQRTIEDNDWMSDIYDHFTVYKWMKVLTTWMWWVNKLIRYVEIEPLSSAEKLKPSKCKFPIQLHRRKPKFGSVMWVSIVEEVEVFQDIISQLTNLQIINARISALWPDMYIDDKIWLDTTILDKSLPWQRILPVSNKSNMPIQNWIHFSAPPAPNQYTDLLIDKLEQRAEESTSISKQNFGISQQWQQTKAEVQQLQQNSSVVLKWIWNNYLRWQKDFWTEMYRSYANNFSKWTKVISMFQKWKAISLELKREDFIADWKVQIVIVSKNQEELENDKDFNKLMLVAQTYLPNITSQYPKNELLRLLWKKSNIRDFDSEKYIRESADEIEAKQNLILLNENIPVPWPEVWQDAEMFLDIYKQAMNTKAKKEAIRQYTEYAKMQAQEKLTQWLPWQGNNQILWMAMNNENTQAQTKPIWQPWL